MINDVVKKYNYIFTLLNVGHGKDVIIYFLFITEILKIKSVVFLW